MYVPTYSFHTVYDYCYCMDLFVIICAILFYINRIIIEFQIISIHVNVGIRWNEIFSSLNSWYEHAVFVKHTLNKRQKCVLYTLRHLIFILQDLTNICKMFSFIEHILHWNKHRRLNWLRHFRAWESLTCKHKKIHFINESAFSTIRMQTIDQTFVVDISATANMISMELITNELKNISKFYIHAAVD